MVRNFTDHDLYFQQANAYWKYELWATEAFPQEDKKKIINLTKRTRNHKPSSKRKRKLLLPYYYHNEVYKKWDTGV